MNWHVKVIDSSAQNYADEVINIEHFPTKEEAEAYADEIEETTQYEAVIGVDVKVEKVCAKRSAVCACWDCDNCGSYTPITI